MVTLPRCERPVLDQHAADRRVGVAALRRIGHPHGAAVGKRDARGALDVDEEGVDRIGEPDELQAAAGKGAGLDRRAVGIFGEAVRRRSRAKRKPGSRAAGGAGGVDLDEIVGLAVERHA